MASVLSVPPVAVLLPGAAGASRLTWVKAHVSGWAGNRDVKAGADGSEVQRCLN